MTLNVVVTATAPLVTLEEAKAHLAVDDDDRDALIQTYIDAAVARVLQYCNLSMIPNEASTIAAFKAAALLATGEYFANREPVFLNGAPIRSLIDPFRWLRV